MADRKRWGVVLAGGVGSRFWPLSTPERPKQFLPLATERPLIVDTIDRLRPLVTPEHTLVLTSGPLAAETARLGLVPRENILVEPRAAGTGAALAWAATEVERRSSRGAIMLCVHADWSIGSADGFRAALQKAADAAESGAALVTVGIVPTRPDPGFGYIHPGREVSPGVREVERFLEKPDRARAEQLIKQGYLWNSGIFVWRAGDLLDEIRALTPEVRPGLEAIAAGERTAERFFGAVRPISIDEGVLERSHRVLVIAGDFGWDDVGTWAALRRVRTLDGSGNAIHGPGHAVATRDSVVYSEGGAVVLYGVEGLVVVVRDGLTLVTTVEASADLKKLLELLPSPLGRAKS